MHDDVLDHAETRRGKESVNMRYGDCGIGVQQDGLSGRTLFLLPSNESCVLAEEGFTLETAYKVTSYKVESLIK